MTEFELLRMLAAVGVKHMPGRAVTVQDDGRGCAERVFEVEVSDSTLRDLLADVRIDMERDDSMRISRFILREPIWGIVEAGSIELA